MRSYNVEDIPSIEHIKEDIIWRFCASKSFRVILNKLLSVDRRILRHLVRDRKNYYMVYYTTNTYALYIREKKYYIGLLTFTQDLPSANILLVSTSYIFKSLTVNTNVKTPCNVQCCCFLKHNIIN